MSKQLPLQPVETDEHGTLRFVKNRIVEKLLDDGPFDLNDIALWGFSEDEYFQFRQMIGYSVDGIPTHHDEQAARIEAHVQGENSLMAVVQLYEERLQMLRESLQAPIAELYEMHPDDLAVGSQKL